MFVPVFDKDGSVIVYDIYIEVDLGHVRVRQWIGSRRTLAQCREAVTFHKVTER